MPKSKSLDPRDPFTRQAERDFRASVRPVYGNSASNPRPEHIGSCLLLEIDGVPLVVTAAHILDQRTQYTLYIAGRAGTRLVPLRGGVTVSTLKWEEGRSSDHFDTAMWIPPDQAVKRLGAVTFLNDARISPIRQPSADRLYTALGLPVSRNKKAVDHVTRSISPRASMYTAPVDGMPELASPLRVTGCDHLFLRFETRSFTGDGACENTFGPRGLSGGPLLDLGDFTSTESYARDPTGSARLAGMVIEYHREYHALVSVRIDTVIHGIRRILARRRHNPVPVGHQAIT
ncbi:MAG: hypothetical protein ACYCRH_12980 [Acidiferrobacteraceae bacterium]